MPAKSMNLEAIRYPVKAEARERDKFPSARYFQIHFEYLESQLAENRIDIQAMQAQIADLASRLSLLMPEPHNIEDRL